VGSVLEGSNTFYMLRLSPGFFLVLYGPRLSFYYVRRFAVLVAERFVICFGLLIYWITKPFTGIIAF
jgi:hypothetical protein